MAIEDRHIEIRASRNFEEDREFLRTIPAGFKIGLKGKENLWGIANHYLHASQEYLKVAKENMKYKHILDSLKSAKCKGDKGLESDLKALIKTIEESYVGEINHVRIRTIPKD